MSTAATSSSTLNFRRFVSALELAAFYAVVTSLTWLAAPRIETPGLAPWILLAIAFGAVYVGYVSPVLIHGDTLAQRGFGPLRHGLIRTDNLREASIRFGVLVMVGGAVLLSWAVVRDPTILWTVSWKAVLIKFTLYLPSAAIQDTIFMSFFLVRLRTILAAEDAPAGTALWAKENRGRVAVCLLTAAAAALFHVPNLPLMLVVIPFGFAAAWFFYRTPNLLPVLLCHALLGTVLHRIVQLHMRLGPFYAQPEKHFVRSLLPVVNQYIGDLF